MQMAEQRPRLRLFWSRKEKDLMAAWDDGISKASGRYVMSIFTDAILKDLDERGFDIATLRFQIRRKAAND